MTGARSEFNTEEQRGKGQRNTKSPSETDKSACRRIDNPPKFWHLIYLMMPPQKLPQRPKMDPERVQELDAWLAKSDQVYAEEPADDSAKLWKAGWLDDLEMMIDGTWRFMLPLFAGNIIVGVAVRWTKFGEF